ncbi:MAG: hypothetical protein FJ171_02760 [Gammaproteobacteria bacterium]|nr:hypothetical protein [Gammaproteobacteria bacterium]
MTLHCKLPVAALLLALAAAFGPTTDAAAGNGHRDGDTRQESKRAISLDEAVARAERRYRARAVRAEEKRHGDRIEYRIRLLADDGRVFQVRIDATTGRED